MKHVEINQVVTLWYQIPHVIFWPWANGGVVTGCVWPTGVHPSAAGGGAAAPGDPAAAAASRTGHAAGECLTVLPQPDTSRFPLNIFSHQLYKMLFLCLSWNAEPYSPPSAVSRMWPLKIRLFVIHHLHKLSWVMFFGPTFLDPSRDISCCATLSVFIFRGYQDVYEPLSCVMSSSGNQSSNRKRGFPMFQIQMFHLCGYSDGFVWLAVFHFSSSKIPLGIDRGYSHNARIWEHNQSHFQPSHCYSVTGWKPFSSDSHLLNFSVT